ncbi:MAG: DegV family protein [Chloroflexota bacterium]|nr:DegV family protein [Chloroflexota bacterium]
MLRIVTDSSAGLPLNLLRYYDIEVVPLKVHFRKMTYREGEDLDNARFYQMLSRAEQLPTTSQPSAGEFHEVYSRLTANGDSVISIHISSKLSGTCQSAVAAKAMLPKADITIIDTLSACMGHGMIVLTAAEAVQRGKSRDEIIALVERVIKEIQILFVVDTLEYLQKGGRIGGASAFLGTLLNIKPLLEIRNGRVEPLEKVRSRKKALRRALEMMRGRFNGQGPLRMAVLHAQCPEEAEQLVQRMKELFTCTDLYFAEINPVIGTHVGPGTLGVVGYPESLIRDSTSR